MTTHEPLDVGGCHEGSLTHHTIATQTLTPEDRILEATCQLYSTTKQQPNQATMYKITAIDMLREVLLGEQTNTLLQNSVQRTHKSQKTAPTAHIITISSTCVSHTGSHSYADGNNQTTPLDVIRNSLAGQHQLHLRRQR